jgi:hypothetical protein
MNYPMSISSAKRGRRRVDSEAVNVRLERPALDALDAYIASQPEPRPSRPQAIRDLLADAFPGAIKSASKRERAAERALLAIRQNAQGIAALVDELVEPAAPPPSDAFLRALEMSEAKAKARKSRGPRTGKGRA